MCSVKFHFKGKRACLITLHDSSNQVLIYIYLEVWCEQFVAQINCKTSSVHGQKLSLYINCLQYIKPWGVVCAVSSVSVGRQPALKSPVIYTMYVYCTRRAIYIGLIWQQVFRIVSRYCGIHQRCAIRRCYKPFIYMDVRTVHELARGYWLLLLHASAAYYLRRRYFYFR